MLSCDVQHLGDVRTSRLFGPFSLSGASVNHSVSGELPLHIAARLSNPELLSLLLDHGADRSLRNQEGKKPLDLAPPHSLAEKLLRQAGGIQ